MITKNQTSQTYKFSLDYSVTASSKKEATKLIKEKIGADAEYNLTADGIDAWLGESIVFSHISN